MPRGFKRTVGDKIVAHCSEMLDLMALANASRGEAARPTSRQCCAQRAATCGCAWRSTCASSPGLWAEATQLLDSVGKQAGGWLNKTREKAPAA
jgi:hypothetical protein